MRNLQYHPELCPVSNNARSWFVHSTQAFMRAVGSPTDVAMLTMRVAAGEGERIVWQGLGFWV
jgi:hypothetical protein